MIKFKSFSIKILFFIVANTGLLANSIIITSREGADVSALSTINTDNIHIVVSNFENIVSAKYQLHVGNTPPSNWASVSNYDFEKDVYFFRKESNQHIRILLEDNEGAITEKIIELQGGTITAPVDDPILPIDYVNGMGVGLIVEADNFRDVYPETTVIALKKAGFNHVRMHIGRLNKTKDGINPDYLEETYFENLDRWIEQIERHGMYCHLGNKAALLTELTMDEEDPKFIETITEEMTTHFSALAERYKYRSHRFAYHIYLESGKLIIFHKGNQDILNAHYAKITEAIRLHDSTRNLIYPPPGINDPRRLDELTFPYEDQNLTDGTTTGTGLYFFSDFHKGFAGGSWHPGEETYEEIVAAALEWSGRTNIPLILSACNVDDRQIYPTTSRVNEIEELYSDLNKGVFPIPVTFLTADKYYDDVNMVWYEDFDQRARVEAINRDASVDPQDPDGDLLSTEFENTIGTNPNLGDTDQDNISDFHEYFSSEMNPLDATDGMVSSDLSQNGDLDGDGISNMLELKYAIIDGASQTLTEVLDITDPNDSETALDGNIPNVWEAILHFNIDSNKTYWPRAGGNVSDSDSDHDNDGVLTKDEVIANTWPLKEDDDHDLDGDYVLVGDIDPIPYIHDKNHIVSYLFDEFTDNSIKNSANQGSDNTGTLVGDIDYGNGILYLNGETHIDINKNDFQSLSNRTIHFHYYGEDETTPQILYKEGNLENGLSIVIAGGNLISTIWKTISGVLNESKTNITIATNQWYAVTVSFNGVNKTLTTSLYNNNRLLNRNTLNLSYNSISMSSTSTISLGGAIEETRVLLNGDSSSTILNNKNFIGFLDDVHIYNRALSQTDISLLSRNDLYPAKEHVFNDSDNDGVFDMIDKCADTPVGEQTNAYGCPVSTLSSDNFEIEVIGESCYNKNNGQLNVVVKDKTLSYKINLEAVNTNFEKEGIFSDAYLLEDLVPGTYNIVISVVGKDYKQYFMVNIAEGKTIAGKVSNVSSKKVSITINKGTAPFKVFVNSKNVLNTSFYLFDLAVQHNDKIEVKSAVTCEGVFLKEINLFEKLIASPNPTKGGFEIDLPKNLNIITIELYNLNSKCLSRNTHPVINGKVQLNIENLPKALYIAKVYLENPTSIKIIKI